VEMLQFPVDFSHHENIFFDFEMHDCLLD